MTVVHTKYFKQWLVAQKQQWHDQQKEKTMCNLTEVQIDMLETTIDKFIDDRRMFTGYDVTRATRERESTQMRHRDVAADIHELDLLTDAVQYGDYKKHSISSPEGGPVILYCPEESDPSEYQLGSNANLGDTNQQSKPVLSKVYVSAAGQTLQGSTLATPASPVPPVTSPLPKADYYVKKVIGDEVRQPSTTSKLWDSHKQKDAPMKFAVSDENKEDDKPKKGEYKLDYRNRLQVPFIRLMTLSAKSGSKVYLLPSLSDENITVSSTSMDSMNEVESTVEKEGVCVSSKVLRSAGFLGNLYQIQNSTRDGNKVIVISEKEA